VIIRRLIFIALIAVIYPAPSAFAQAVRSSYSGLSGQNLPFWLTYDAGLYSRGVSPNSPGFPLKTCGNDGLI
jgi:hypothetical protein